MAIDFGAAGTAVYSTGDPNPSYPTGATALSEFVLLTYSKPTTANGGTLANPSGFTRRGENSGATDGDTGGYGGTVATDTGNMNLFVLTKDTVTGSETGALGVVNHTGQNHAMAQIVRLEKDAAGTTDWATAVGKDTSAGNVSVTTGTIDLAPGDLLIWAMAIPTNVTTPAQFSAHAISATGITFGTVTEMTEWDTASGTDSGGFVAYAKVTSGTDTVACTITATAGGTTTNVRGPVVLLRARPPAGGTTFTVDPVGTVASDATLTRQGGKVAGGTVGPAGVLARLTGRAIPLGGSDVDPSGVLTRRTSRSLTGSVASSGTVARAKVALLTLVALVAPTGILTRQGRKATAGAVGPVGVLTRRPARALAGSVAPAATLARQAGKVLAGVVASAGTLATEVGSTLKLLAVAGTLAAAGGLARRSGKATAGTTGPAGSVTRQDRKGLAGTATSSSTLARVKVAILTLAGAVGPVGVLVRRMSVRAAGGVGPVGVVVRRAGLRFVGAVVSAGAGAVVVGGVEAWSWLVSRGGILRAGTARVSRGGSSHPTTTTVQE